MASLGMCICVILSQAIDMAVCTSHCREMRGECSVNWRLSLVRVFPLRHLCRCERDRNIAWSYCALNVGSHSGFLYVLNKQTGLLDPGMLVNIQQPLIREDGTVLLATDSKVMLCRLLYLYVVVQTLL